jgi:hypothetical protein
MILQHVLVFSFLSVLSDIHRLPAGLSRISRVAVLWCAILANQIKEPKLVSTFKTCECRLVS